MNRPLYFLIADLIVILDQLVKFYVRAAVPLHTSRPLLPGMNLTYVQNTGAAFSLLEGFTWPLAVLSGLVSVVLALALFRKFLPTRLGMISLALLLGGAVGNFIDRAFLGFVTDMFATTFVRFAVFNVADIGVTLGGGLLVIAILLAYRQDRQVRGGKGK